MVVFFTIRRNCAKVVVFGQSSFFRANWWYSGKVVELRQNWLYSGKVVVFGQGYCNRAKVVIFGYK